MRLHKRANRAVLALGLLFCSALLCSGVAYSAESIPIRVYSVSELKANAEAKQRAEQAEPAGTRVYYYDYYQITYGPNSALVTNDGPNSALVTIDTTFRRDRNGVLYATDIQSGVTTSFPRGAKIQRENNLGEKFLRPGESLDPSFQRLILLGGSRFVKVLGGSSQAAAPIGTCPEDGRWIGDGCNQKIWTGGGAGSVDPHTPQYLTALANSCKFYDESLVSFSYNVATTYPPGASVSTSFCATVGSTVEPCYYFSGDSPGSSHNRSITYYGGGGIGASLGFHYNGVDNNGAGSGTAPACMFRTPGC